MCFENSQPKHSSELTRGPGAILSSCMMQNNYLVNWENIRALDTVGFNSKQLTLSYYDFYCGLVIS